MLVSGETVLVIHDGSPEALVASLICPDPGCVMAWFPPHLPTARNSRMQTVKRQVDLLGLDSLITPGGSDSGAGDRQASPFVKTLMLLQAVTAAASLGCGRVVWPNWSPARSRNRENLDALGTTSGFSGSGYHTTWRVRSPGWSPMAEGCELVW